MDGWTPTPEVASPAPTLRPMGAMTMFAVIMTVIILVGQILQLVFLGSTGRFVSYETDNIEQAIMALVLVMILGALGVAQMIAGLMWFYRASSNVTLRGLTDRKWGPGWSVGAWFIPIANAFLGFLAIFEIWRGSQPEADANNWHHLRIPGWIYTWWGLYIAYTLASVGYALYTFIVTIQASAAAIRGGADPEAFEPYLPAQLGMFALYVVAGVLYIVFMLQVRRLQDNPERMPAAPF